MNNCEAMLQEFRVEAETTRRVLDRVPADKLTWKPHERSMSLGQLALHIATVPAGIARITQPDAFDVSKNSFVPPSPESIEQVHAALEQSVQIVDATLTGATDEVASGDWHLMLGERELYCQSRETVWRSLMLNHWYHHRGQLSIYLRMLDVPVPSIYGPSADENPFS